MVRFLNFSQITRKMSLSLPYEKIPNNLYFKEGRKAISIKEWSIEEFADKPIEELREKVFNQRERKLNPMRNLTIREISQFGSFATIAAGIFGMLFCFPFLWSSNIADLVGAGFPFVAGAILTIGGLINLSILSRQIQIENLKKEQRR